MADLTKKEAEKIVKEFFESYSLDKEKVRKIKKLAMAHRIRLKDYRKRFCRKCFSDLRLAKARVTKYYKNITCIKCGMINRWKVK